MSKKLTQEDLYERLGDYYETGCNSGWKYTEEGERLILFELSRGKEYMSVEVEMTRLNKKLFQVVFHSGDTIIKKATIKLRVGDTLSLYDSLMGISNIID